MAVQRLEQWSDCVESTKPEAVFTRQNATCKVYGFARPCACSHPKHAELIWFVSGSVSALSDPMNARRRIGWKLETPTEGSEHGP